MASLDDFFKKRDKKKKTTKSKLDIDEISKKLEANNENNADDFDQESNLSETTKEIVGTSNSASILANGDGVDEEWMPFDAGENKDLTGLKINTATWNVDDEFGENEGGYEGGEKKPSFKWGEKAVSKKETDNDQNDDEKEDEPEQKNNPQIAQKQLNDPTSKPLSNTTTEAKTEALPTSTGAYVPPSMRGKPPMESSSAPPPAAAPASTGAYVPPSMRGKTGNESSSSAIPTSSVNYRKPNKSQPNIMDTMEFPTLDNAEPSSNEKVYSNNTNNEKFELAKRSGKVDQKSGNNMIDIGNSFSALSS
jgi:hypothetical protein